jgi:hypothetical protein
VENRLKAATDCKCCCLHAFRGICVVVVADIRKELIDIFPSINVISHFNYCIIKEELYIFEKNKYTVSMENHSVEGRMTKHPYLFRTLTAS